MIKEEEEEKGAAGAAVIIWDCGSPLYDSYELVSLVNYIERHMMFICIRDCDHGVMKLESRYEKNTMGLLRKMKVNKVKREFHKFFSRFGRKISTK